MPAYVDTMVYRGQTPWHGLGAQLSGEWIESAALVAAAGLEWEAVKSQAFYQNGLGAFAAIPGQFTIVRSDTGLAIGGTEFGACTVGKQYEPFQNSELIALGDALCATGEARWETAGSLKGGRLVWGLAQVAGAIEVKRRDGAVDTHASYLLLNNTHDGTSHLRAMFTDVRVVCANTNGWALGTSDRKRAKARREGEDTEGEGAEVLARSFTSRHTSGIHDRAAEAAEALGVAIEAREEHSETYQGLADTPMSDRAFRGFVAQLLTGFDDPKEAEERVREVATGGGRAATILDNKGSQLCRLFEDESAGNKGQDRYDAINSVTDWIDHQRNRIAVHRATSDRLGVAAKSFESGQFGNGAQVKRRALALLTR